MKRKLLLVFALVFGALGFAGTRLAAQQAVAPAGGAPPPGRGPYEVRGYIRVADGESFDTRINGNRVLVRLIGVDAPPGNTPCGRAAAAQLQMLIGGGALLEEDPAQGFDGRKRRLYQVSTLDGRPVARELVAAGLARATAPGREAASLAAAEGEARLAGRGCLWGGAPPRLGDRNAPAGTAVRSGPPSAAATESVSLPSGFVQETLVSGLSYPSAMLFLPDGRMLIGEHQGTIRLYANGVLQTEPFLDIRDRVNDYLDRGLLSMIIDPDYSRNGYIYVYYIYEDNPADYSASKTARLSRFTVDQNGAGNSADPASEVVLLGKQTAASCDDLPVTADCIPADSPSHNGGGMVFAPDGTLFLTIGDAASFTVVDDQALRAQQLDSLAGKVLRITTSGAAAPGNPFFTGDPNANRSKVWATGVRSPFRITLRPGTSTLYLSDVGWNTWEEVDVVEPGRNFGWPCYEGPAVQGGYQSKAVCQALYAQGSGAVQTPLIAYNHSGNGAAVISGAFYTGTDYPAEYRGAFFYADFVRSWIRYARVDANNNLVGMPLDFAADTDGPVAIEPGPNGDLYILAINVGAVRRIRYTGPTSYPPPPAGTSYLSDLEWTSATNGWGPVERDRSVGELPGGDGRPITINGTVYAKGLGVNAVSNIRYYLGGVCTSLTAALGLDDEVGAAGSVYFEVYGDEQLLYRSPRLTGGSAVQSLNISVAGRRDLRLSVTDAGDGSDLDHADWADARITCGTAADTTPPVVTVVTPAENATAVELSTRVAAIFSEALDPATVGVTTVTLRRQGTAVAATVSYDAATRRAVLTPVANLVAGAVYTATVKGGAGGVKDIAGNALQADKVWTFTAGTGNTPPTPTIQAPTSSTLFRVGEMLSFSGTAVDAQDGGIPAAGLRWEFIQHHCQGSICHTHLVRTISGSGSGTFRVDDHGDDNYYLEFRLTATDSDGLSASTSVTVQPRTVEVRLETNPPGLTAGYGDAVGAAPLTRVAIVGAVRTVGAPSPQNGHYFTGWSDGGAAQHDITVPESNLVLTAQFAVQPPAVTTQVTLEGRTAVSPGGTGFAAGFGMVTVTATRTDVSGQAPVVVSGGAYGSVTVLSLPVGVYTFTARAPGYLPAERTGVVVTGVPITLPPVQLWAGMVTPDTVINLHDLTVTLAAFGQSTPNRMNAAGRVVDLNGDGAVTIADVVLIITNFGRSGTQPW